MPVAYAKGDLKQALLLQRSLPNSKASLFSKTGSGEFYTLYPDGLEVQDANIGGFKSVQLDPKEENLYFYDSGSKVISRINLKDGKVYKVIGKPKNSKKLDYSGPVRFSEASLVDFTDFTLDKNGDIFILDSNKRPQWDNNPRPRILKASLGDGTLKQVIDIENFFLTKTGLGSNPFKFSLDGITSDPAGKLFLYGKVNETASGINNRPIILKFNESINRIEIFAGYYNPDTWLGNYSVGWNQKIHIPTALGEQDLNRLNITGLNFDHLGNIYLSYTHLRPNGQN